MLLSYIFVLLVLFSNKGLGSLKEKKLKKAVKKNGLTVPGEMLTNIYVLVVLSILSLLP